MFKHYFKIHTHFFIVCFVLKNFKAIKESLECFGIKGRTLTPKYIFEHFFRVVEPLGRFGVGWIVC